MAPTRTIYFHTMSNPNTNAVMYMLRGALRPPEATATGFKTVYIISDRLPVRILEMAHLTCKAWQKSSSFDSLATILWSHVDNLGILDLLTVVSTEVHLDTTTSYIEAEVIKKTVLSSILNIVNLLGVSFLNGTGGTIKTPATTDKKYRTKDMIYIRLSCTIDVIIY